MNFVKALKKGNDLFKSDGLFETLKWGTKFVAWKLGVDYLYKELFSEYIILSVSGKILQFDSDKVSMFYDFRNDFDGEKKVLKDLLNSIRENDVFFDIGANVGVYSCFVATEVLDENVYAIEPHPEMSKTIKKNATKNDLSINVIEVALSDTSGSVDLLVEGPTTSKISLTESDKKSINVRLKRGDVVSQEERNPSVMKIDVEGHELRVLKGFEKTLSNNSCRLLYCEKHHSKTNENDEKDGVINYLENIGFSCSVIYERRTQSYIKAIKKD